MNIFLKPYVIYMDKMANGGIVFNVNAVEQRFYVHAVCCCVDSVARSPMVGFVQYNGYFGCHWCLHPGVYIRYNGGGCVNYSLLDEQPLKRNERDTWQHMQLSTQSVNPVFGVKKPSILVNLNSFNVISGLLGIYLGIAEQFSKYWFDTNNRPYSLSNAAINIIDELALQIKAPNQISRLSRSMEETKWLKARELENWILYYSLPILLYFPHMLVYVKHWSLLVEAFNILNRKSISRIELNRAHRLLQKFVIYTEYYYTTAAMTCNVRQLLHIRQSVADMGHCGAIMVTVLKMEMAN
ncbi:hypothetical protein TSAR_016257 [Trichomalopsis sarcophagae]|uniref:Uncharacterized protein n=1 Tax=Trichomalopsis sarcophagae TaxID=543379 RepID=A0A232EIU7_9HYME|nr:hypothetical protein TSAR_016257 [Trichomalopsis sarcophagae]